MTSVRAGRPSRVDDREPVPEDPGAEPAGCQEGIPNLSDLTVTGVVVSPEFTRSDSSSIGSYSIVWQTLEQAQADWARTVTRMPAFIDCLADVLGGGPKASKIVVTSKGAVAFPTVTARTSAHRIKLAVATTVRGKKKRKRKRSPFANLDFVLVGSGRASVTMTLLSFAPKPFTPSFERSLAEKMTARMVADPVSTPSP
jgi:hypothetical protein